MKIAEAPRPGVLPAHTVPPTTCPRALPLHLPINPPPRLLVLNLRDAPPVRGFFAAKSPADKPVRPAAAQPIGSALPQACCPPISNATPSETRFHSAVSASSRFLPRAVS